MAAVNGPPYTNPDPAGTIAAAIEAAAKANRAVASDIAGLVGQLRGESAKIVANQAAHEMHLTAKMILLRHFKWTLVWTGLAGVTLYGLGVATGRLVAPHSDITGMTCQDQPDGGRVCYVWVTPPPSASPSAAPAPTAKRGHT